MFDALTRRGAVACLAMIGAVASFAAMPVQPSPPPVRPVTDDYFGVPVTDPYRYMEDLKNPEVAAWMKSEANYARATLDRIPQRDALLREVTKFGNAAAARVSSLTMVDGHAYYLKRNANDDIPKLYVRDHAGAGERLLVDPDKAPAPSGEHSAIDFFQPSPDNRYLAYGISVGGSEQSVLHVLDVATGKETGDVIDRANDAQPSFLPDGRLLYSRLQKLSPGAPVTDKYKLQKTYIHVIGSDPEQDVAILGSGVSPDIAIAPAEMVFADSPVGSRYVIAAVVNGVQNEIKLYAALLTQLEGAKTPWKKIVDTSDDVTGFDVRGDDLYLLSHHQASRYKLLRVSLDQPSIADATVVLPEGEAVVTGLGVASDALYVQRMNGGSGDLLKIAYADHAQPVKVPLPFSGNVDSLHTDPRRAGVVFELSGWTRYGGFFDYNPKTGKAVDARLQPQGKYDNPKDLVVEEVKARAADGTMIPMSIVYRKGLKRDGSNPTTLWGYGAYGISQTASYSPTFLPWFNRGGIFVVANVRGGGEFGEDWHLAGYKATKANTWNDTIACAEWLIANKYTSPAKLAVRGGSAGGILVGRAITERPDLFAVALDDVPVSDTLREETSANGVPNIPEFGSVTTKAGFDALYAMSPYAHIKSGTAYPAVLLTTGINDPRVDAWEAAKMAARLQAASTSGKPILLRIDYDEGHGYGETKKSAYAATADRFAFQFWQFGVRGFQPK